MLDVMIKLPNPCFLKTWPENLAQGGEKVLFSNRLGNGHAGIRNEDIQFTKILDNFLDVLLDSLGVRYLDLVPTPFSAKSILPSKPSSLTL
ncbi:hypothetical protein KC333_g42 [Hortaea werneckii]|nr:hypothetical protein KC333_g42 [Hortaea werneckii]